MNVIERGCVMKLSDCIIKPDKVPGYIPEAHTGTVNQRLIGQETGAKNLEVLLGTVAAGGQAEPHSHRSAEQVIYILAGSIEVEMWGERQVATSGEAVFLPAGQAHSLSAHGGQPAKVLVIYAPPMSR